MELQTGTAYVRMDEMCNFYRVTLLDCGPGGSVGIATGDWLDGPGSNSGGG